MMLFDSIRSFFKSQKKDPESFYSMVQSSQWKSFIGKDEIKMIKGVIKVSELQVRDIMVPRSNMIVLERSFAIDRLLKTISDSGHSRFPVIGENKDEVLGILLAKDLLRFSKDSQENFDMEGFIRPATFIPESKRLKILLKEFRKSRNHFAIVVDEYGRTAGLLTIEDVLEQIVGDIIVCLPIVEKEAKVLNIEVSSHFLHMVIHGFLHLLGYDHNTDKEEIEMIQLENLVLTELGIENSA